MNVDLKNNSGEDHVINYDYLFFPVIPGWSFYEDIPNMIDHPIVEHYIQRLFGAGETLRNIETWGFESGPRSFGATLTPGMHELKFNAFFTSNLHQENQQQIEVWSDPITLTVLQNAQESNGDSP